MSKPLKRKKNINIETIKALGPAKIIALAGFFVAALMTAVFAFQIVRERTATWSITTLGGLAVPTAIPDDLTAEPAENNSGQQLVSVPEAPDWDGTSRVTVLVVGLDYRDWEADLSAPRTDTMILLTFDPLSKKAGVLNIPRDLWVNIPGFGYGKINTAYQNGENAKLPGGGPGLAIRTVEEFLGVKIDYFAQVDFSTFAEVVDFYQGILFTSNEDLVLEMIGTEDRLYLKANELVVLDGDMAVAVARYRGTSGGDFDRSKRQQQLLINLLKKVTEPEWLQYSLTHANEIWGLFSSGIRTNMSLDEILGIGWKVKDIDPDDIILRAITPPNMVTLAKSPEGLDILKPITSEIRVVRDEVFSTSSVVLPNAVGNEGDLPTLMINEGASIALYNGTSQAGLASTTRDYLESLGFTISAIGNRTNNAPTTLNVYTSKPFTMQYLAEVMDIQISNIYYLNDPGVTVDIEVIIGSEWVVPAP